MHTKRSRLIALGVAALAVIVVLVWLFGAGGNDEGDDEDQVTASTPPAFFYCGKNTFKIYFFYCYLDFMRYIYITVDFMFIQEIKYLPFKFIFPMCYKWINS